VEWDKVNGLVKINPLIDWTEQQVWDYADRLAVSLAPVPSSRVKIYVPAAGGGKILKPKSAVCISVNPPSMPSHSSISLNRNILRLAVPNIISNLTVPLLGMADFALMSHLKTDSVVYVGARWELPFSMCFT